MTKTLSRAHIHSLPADAGNYAINFYRPAAVAATETLTNPMRLMRRRRLRRIPASFSAAGEAAAVARTFRQFRRQQQQHQHKTHRIQFGISRICYTSIYTCIYIIYVICCKCSRVVGDVFSCERVMCLAPAARARNMCSSLIALLTV